ncbi:MAG TPA: hypothetical protein VL172_10375, partial [Kofleriaceae bacterium]|nr:hypothetical protein [Kofleriaceae bacterium]
YSADGQTPLWRASDTVDPAGGTWTQTAIEAAALLAGDDSTSGRSTIQTELDRGKAQIDLALAAGQPMNILMKGIRTPDAGLYNSENTMALYDVQRSFADGRYAVVLGNSNGLLSATQPQWGEALTALALIKYAHTRGVPVRVIAHSNGNSSLGGLVEVAATWGLLEPLGIVKKVVMIAPSATDVRLRHIFTAFTTWWNQNQTRVDVIFGDNDNVLDASEMFLGPGPVGINLATGMTEMIISGVVLGAKFGGWLGAGIGAAIGFIVGLFVDSPAERAQDFLEAVEDNPGWFGGWVHVSFINQSVHDLSRYCDNSQTVAALAYSQCVIGSRECVQDCTMTMTPLGDYNVNGNYRWVDMGAEGGAVALDVATVDSCAWQANAWCVLEDPFDPDNNQTVPCDGVLGDQGDANGQADLVIGANSGAARTITIQVDAVLRNGLTSGQATRSYFTVVQAAP